MERLVSKKIIKPHFVGDIDRRAREIVAQSNTSTNVQKIAREVRKVAAGLADGIEAKVVRLPNTRTAIHGGPFPVEGYEVLETVRVRKADEKGAVVIERTAYQKNA